MKCPIHQVPLKECASCKASGHWQQLMKMIDDGAIKGPSSFGLKDMHDLVNDSMWNAASFYLSKQAMFNDGWWFKVPKSPSFFGESIVEGVKNEFPYWTKGDSIAPVPSAGLDGAYANQMDATLKALDADMDAMIKFAIPEARRKRSRWDAEEAACRN